LTVYLLATFGGVMKSIGGIALAVAVLLAMVTIHEFGHYIVGKRLGFKINEFSVGFGPALLKKRSKKTGELFALRLVPLGGYCAFDGEDEDDEEESQTPSKEAEPSADLENEGGRVESTEEKSVDELFTETEIDGSEEGKPAEEKQEDEYPEPKGERFNNQPPWKRILVLLAGAVMNYLLALTLIIIMVGIYGEPMCIAMPIDYEDGMVVEHEDWETPYLSQRDILLEINGEDISMITDCIDALQGKKAGDEVPVTVLRKRGEEWQEKEVILVLQADADFENMADTQVLENVLGLEIYTTTLQRGFWRTIGASFEYSWEMGTAVIRSLGELITGKLGVDSMGGPVTTITTTAQAATVSPFSFLYIASFIGVNLAVFNLLPIPALDGCKIIFCIIEWIRKKPVNRKVEAIIHFAGIIFLFGFAILVDLLQLF